MGMYFYYSGNNRGTFTHMDIRNNRYGVYLRNSTSSTYNGNSPLPVITDSALYDNTSYNVYTKSYNSAENYVINMQRNWWGNGIKSFIDRSLTKPKASDWYKKDT